MTLLEPGLVLVLLAKHDMLSEEEQFPLYIWRDPQCEKVLRGGSGEEGEDEVVWPRQDLLPQLGDGRHPGNKMRELSGEKCFHLATCWRALTKSLPTRRTLADCSLINFAATFASISIRLSLLCLLSILPQDAAGCKGEWSSINLRRVKATAATRKGCFTSHW